MRGKEVCEWGTREEEGEEGRVEAGGEEEARDTDKTGKTGELLMDWHVCEAEKSPADGDADADSGRTFRRASSLVDELTELARSEGLDGRVELAVGTCHPAGGLGLVLRGHSPPRVVGLLSAAALSGMVQVGDELASIDGIRANGMGIEELTALMAGDVGTRCTLSLIRRSELVEVTLERREMSRSRGLVQRQSSCAHGLPRSPGIAPDTSSRPFSRSATPPTEDRKATWRAYSPDSEANIGPTIKPLGRDYQDHHRDHSHQDYAGAHKEIQSTTPPQLKGDTSGADKRGSSSSWRRSREALLESRPQWVSLVKGGSPPPNSPGRGSFATGGVSRSPSSSPCRSCTSTVTHPAVHEETASIVRRGRSPLLGVSPGWASVLRGTPSPRRDSPVRGTPSPGCPSETHLLRETPSPIGTSQVMGTPSTCSEAETLVSRGLTSSGNTRRASPVRGRMVIISQDSARVISTGGSCKGQDLLDEQDHALGRDVQRPLDSCGFDLDEPQRGVLQSPRPPPPKRGESRPPISPPVNSSLSPSPSSSDAKHSATLSAWT